MIEREKEALLHQRQLAFIGKMLTAFTQKMPHHVTALQASAGRLANLLEQADPETEEDNKKLADLLSTIVRYLEIFGRKTHHLNRFGQRMGRQLSTFNPGELIEEAVLFSTRLAHLRKVSIKLEVDEILPSLYSDPVCIHFLVSIAIHKMLERVGEGGRVLLRIGCSDKKLLIRVAGNGPFVPIALLEPEAEDSYWSIGQEMAANLGGHLEPADIERDTKLITLFLPVEQGFKELWTDMPWTE